MVEKVDATKVRFDRDAALALARTAGTVVAGRGGNAVELDPNATADNVLAGHLLGPSGNLKAPTIRLGTTLLVGFNDATYSKYFEAPSIP